MKSSGPHSQYDLHINDIQMQDSGLKQRELEADTNQISGLNSVAGQPRNARNAQRTKKMGNFGIALLLAFLLFFGVNFMIVLFKQTGTQTHTSTIPNTNITLTKPSNQQGELNTDIPPNDQPLTNPPQTPFKHNHQPFPPPIPKSKTPPNRIPLSQAQKKAPPPELVLLTPKNPIGTACTIINSISLPITSSPSGLDTIAAFLQSKKMMKIIVYNAVGVAANQTVRKIHDKLANQEELGVEILGDVDFNAGYRWVTDYVDDCGVVVYLHARVRLEEENARELEAEIQELPNLSIAYTQSCFTPGHNQTQLTQLPNLQTTDISSISQAQLTNYIFVLSPKFIKILSPLSFSYHTGYNLQQYLIYPILAICQNSPNIVPISPLHTCADPSLSAIEYPIVGVREQGKFLCFVSYPVDPFLFDLGNFGQYVAAIAAMDLGLFRAGLVVYVPYAYQQNDGGFVGLVEKLLGLVAKNGIKYVRLRILWNKAVSSHAVYQSSYLYCPTQSLIISCRHNAAFLPNFPAKLFESMSQRYHYYHIAHQQRTEKETGDTTPIYIEQTPRYRGPYFVRSHQSQALYRKYFQHVQIFRSDLFRTIPFWIIKAAQLDFYETEAVFFIYMMETIRMNVKYINQTLVTISARNQSQTQQNQIRNLQKYVEYSPLPGNNLVPYQYNCLLNEAYRRHAPDRISKIVHQIWIGNSNISKIRMKLHETIREHNPSYQVILWKNQNITKENFPMTYALVERTFQYQKTSKRSYYALTADLLRYEMLYQRGGIYIDFKMEVLKSLDPFLKYEIFFIDAGVDKTRFKSPVAVGVGIIGAMKNSYYFRTVLTELITSSKINFKSQYIPGMTGGVVVRKVFTDQQLFTVVGFGYHLFIPKPSAGDINDCGKVRKFDSDQEIFQVHDSKSQKIFKIGIPCKQYPEAYILSYKPLASTWKGEKRKIN